MAFDIRGALRAGFRRAAAPNGRAIVGALFLAQLATQVGRTAAAQSVLEEVPASERPAPGMPTGDPVLDLPLGAAALLSLLGTVATSAVLVVAVRTFVTDRSKGFPDDVGRRLVTATIQLFVGNVAFTLLLALGLVLFVLPGLIVAVSLVFFVVFVAVEDDNFVAAMRNSWSFTRGRWMEIGIFLVATIAFMMGIVLIGTIPVAVVGADDPLFVTVVGAIASAAAATYAVAAVSRAYVEIRDDVEDDDEFSDIDDELLP